MCPVCDQQFIAQIHGSYSKTTCSRACSNTFFKERRHTQASRTKRSHALKGKLSPRRGSGADHTCKTCRTTYKMPDHQSTVFCSTECKLAYQITVAATRQLALQSYRTLAAFKFNVYDHPDKFNLQLLEKHGWYKAINHGNNLTGVSRDHLFSVSDGFKLGIDPTLLAHPANCQLLIQTDNARKRARSIISVDELKERIKNF